MKIPHRRLCSLHQNLYYLSYIESGAGDRLIESAGAELLLNGTTNLTVKKFRPYDRLM